MLNFSKHYYNITMRAEEPEEVKNCPHFKRMISNNYSIEKYSFIKPQTKGWICLNDGCSRKVGQFQSIKQQIQKFEPFHKIFMDMNKLQIYCFQCNIQITDLMDKNAYLLRSLAIEEDKQQQKMLFGANIEYSPGFHKEKAGLSGTIGNQLNSYINSVIQLLAHTLPFYLISEQSNLSTIKDECLRQTFNCINKIRSGVYRIVETKAVQTSLLLKNLNFHKYSFKTPSNFIYEILRSFSEQFEYNGPQCNRGQMISIQTMSSSHGSRTKYSPMKELFAGEFIWQVKCRQCECQKSLKIQFQCLRLENESKFVDKTSSKLQQLIQNAFNFEKLFNNMYSGVICDKGQCKNKKSNFKLIHEKSHIKMPNILLFEFVSDEGMNVQYPDIIDLTKYAGVQNQSYQFHYVGSIAKANKKYFTHVRENRENGFRQYIFDDVLIKQDASRPSKIVSAIYKMQPLIKNKNISKNIQSAVIVDVESYVPLPDFWIFYASQLRNVQPLINPFICRHGLLAPQMKSKSKAAKKIPPSIYQYLVQQFGGALIKIQKQQDTCQRCMEKLSLIKQLKQSEKEMAKFADQLSSKKSKACVDIEWFQKWKKYLYQSPDWFYQNQGPRRPGPINNKKGLKQNNQIDEKKYKKVSPQVWYFFKRFYGGGPLIAKNLTPPSLALTQAVDLRYDRIKKILEMLEPL